MEPTLKVPFAMRSGELIHISKVSSGATTDCTCPACGELLTVRKGKRVRHHFAHRAKTNCKPETALHRIAKLLLRDGIKRALDDGREVLMTWECLMCGDKHSGNLLRSAKEVGVEETLGERRPDLTLFGPGRKPIAVIEVVVSHEPDPAAREFYAARSIPVMELHIHTDADVERLYDLREFHASFGSVCTRKKCTKCKKRLNSVFLHIVEEACWRCGCLMSISFASCERMFAGPEEFTPLLVQLARKYGVRIAERYGNVTRGRYCANVCRKCGAFYGKHYLHDLMMSCDKEGDIFAGYHCSCEWEGSKLVFDDSRWTFPE